MSLFKRNLKKCGKPINLVDRNMSIFNGLPAENFSNPVPVTALVKTLNGVTVFDNTNTERVATHQFCIEFIEDVTSEKWINFKGKNIKVLTVENCCENDEKLILMCTERGLDSEVVNQA